MSVDETALRKAFVQEYARAPAYVSVAPGRVNLIGEHTDYNQGWVLPMAIDRAVAVAVRTNETNMVRAVSLDFDEGDEFDLGEIGKVESVSWRNYARAVFWAIRELGKPVSGMDLAISGDIPLGAGLSSSAALEVAIAGAISVACGLGIDGQRLARIAQRAENDFVRVECGIMDQLAAAAGVAGNALLIDCRFLAVDPVPMPDGVDIVVVEFGVSRQLSETPYNLRRQECAEAARALGVPSLRDADEAFLDAKGRGLAANIFRRATHVVSENRRVLEAVEALWRGDVDQFGGLMYQSHTSLRDDFDVSCPELDLLVDLARATEGVLGARLTGAGFGGCTVNLVLSQATDAFSEAVLAPYCERTGLTARMYVCQAADGLRVSGV